MGPAQTLVWVLSGTPVLPTRAGTRCCHVACGLWRGTEGRAWRKASEPRDLCIYYRDRAPPDRPAGRRCADSAFIVPRPSDGRRRPDQAAYLSNQATDSTPTPQHTRSGHHDLDDTKEPSATRQLYSSGGCRGTGGWCKVTDISCSGYLICYDSEPMCRGSESFCTCPPSAIKGGGMRASRLRPNLSLTSSYKLSSNTSHSGVGYYASAARTTLNPCVLLCSSHFSI
jgi:hypothetical protein